MSVPVPRAKVDPSKLRLFSIPRKGSFGSSGSASAPASRCASADNTTAAVSRKPLGANGNSLAGQLKPRATPAAADVPAASSSTPTPLYHRETSKASSITSKRSMSSEEARKQMKDRMSRPPDIAVGRGGNINIDSLTPDKVNEFWMRKQQETEEFWKRRALLKQQREQQQQAAAEGSAPAAQHVTTVAAARQPLRGIAKAAPSSSNGKLAPQSGSAGRQASNGTAAARAVSPGALKASSPGTCSKPVNSSTPTSKRKTSVPSVGAPSPSAASVASNQGSTSSPIARRLLVGSAAATKAASITRCSSAGSQPRTSATKPVVHHNSKTHLHSNAIMRTAGNTKQSSAQPSHVDPTVAPQPSAAPESPAAAAVEAEVIAADATKDEPPSVSASPLRETQRPEESGRDEAPAGGDDVA